MSINKKLIKAIKRAAKPVEDKGIPAFLGDLTGIVKSSDGNVYISLQNGQVHTAKNNVVPNIPRLPVMVGRDDHGDFFILRGRNSYINNPFPEIPDHAELSHQWPRHDTLWVRSEQFVPGLAIPTGGMNVKLFGFVYYLAGWHIVENQVIDFTAEIPASGANWLVVQIDDAMTISYVTGTTVAARELLTYELIPDADAGNKSLFAVKLYLGQTQIRKLESDSDIADLRWGGLASGFDLAAEIHAATASAITDNDEMGFWEDVSGLLRKITWANIKATLKTYFDTLYLLLTGNGATTQLLQWTATRAAKWITMSGDATIADGGAVSVNKTRLNIRNETGSTIATTRAVYTSGFNNLPLILLADNTDEAKHNVIGVTVGSIAHQANGYIATSGQCDAETNAWTVGTELYLSTAGTLTSTEPTSGSVQHIGIVTVQANYPTGKLLIYLPPEGNTMSVGAGQNNIIRMGDNAGANKVSFRDYANNEVASINSDGLLTATLDPELQAIAGLTSAANKIAYFTGLGTAALADFTAAGRALVDDADAAAQRTTLGVREVLTAARTYYVRTDGSNSNTGLVDSAGGAFLTIQKAIDVVTGSTIDFGGQTVTIQIRDGTYTGAISVSSPWTGGGALTIQGNSGTPANVLLSVTGNSVFTVTCALPGIFTIKDLKLQTTTSGHGILHSGAGTVQIGNLNFGAIVNVGINCITPSAYVLAISNYSITGGGSVHWNSFKGGVIEVTSRTITITGTPAFVAFAQCIRLGLLEVYSNTFSGSATGTRYYADTNAVIFVNGGGATYLPGNAAGSTATGGQYA